MKNHCFLSVQEVLRRTKRDLQDYYSNRARNTIKIEIDWRAFLRSFALFPFEDLFFTASEPFVSWFLRFLLVSVYQKSLTSEHETDVVTLCLVVCDTEYYRIKDRNRMSFVSQADNDDESEDIKSKIQKELKLRRRMQWRGSSKERRQYFSGADRKRQNTETLLQRKGSTASDRTESEGDILFLNRVNQSEEKINDRSFQWNCRRRTGQESVRQEKEEKTEVKEKRRDKKRRKGGSLLFSRDFCSTTKKKMMMRRKINQNRTEGGINVQTVFSLEIKLRRILMRENQRCYDIRDTINRKDKDHLTAANMTSFGCYSCFCLSISQSLQESKAGRNILIFGFSWRDRDSL